MPKFSGIFRNSFIDECFRFFNKKYQPYYKKHWGSKSGEKVSCVIYILLRVGYTSHKIIASNTEVIFVCLGNPRKWHEKVQFVTHYIVYGLKLLMLAPLILAFDFSSGCSVVCPSFYDVSFCASRARDSKVVQWGGSLLHWDILACVRTWLYMLEKGIPRFCWIDIDNKDTR